MRPRFLLVATDGLAGWPSPLEDLARRTGLATGFAQPPIAVLVNPHCRCLGIGERGVVVGTLFDRHGRARPVESLDAGDAEAILESRGDRLLSAYWGGYVAAIPGPGSIRVLREPSAALPCYFVRAPGFAAFASDVDLLIESGLAGAELDWAALARHLFNAGVPTPATALRGMEELLAGFAVDLFGEPECQSPCWLPWDHVAAEAVDPDAVAERLARTVRHCVQAWASPHAQLLVSVSGGLDSSIVAASLADAGREATCLTLYGDDPGGDERAWARELCDRLGFPLIERPYGFEHIDLARPLAAHLPRPSGRTQALAYERAHLETARDISADAFVTGNGGDSVFGYSQSAAAIADRYLAEGPGAGVIGTLRDVCRQTGCGALQAAASAIRIARGPGAYRCRPATLFLHRDVLAALAGAGPDHPWLAAPADALPGKAAHIASILRVQQCLEPGRSCYRPVLNPLMSQPVIEACLAIPSWEWRAGGRDRSLARRAFAASLPESILKRRIKGGPDGFAARIVERLRGPIRERLLDGHLARHGIVDTKAIGEALEGERPVSGEERVRILELVAAEAWLDFWSSRPGRRPAQTEREGGC